MLIIGYIMARPEYWHVVINHIPIECLLLSTLILIVGFVIRNRVVCRTALASILFASLCAWPVYWLGDASYDRVTAQTDEEGVNWLDQHQQRARVGIYIFSACALFAALALSSYKSEKWELRLTACCLLLCIFGVATAVWIADAGGKITHREFRVMK